MSAGGSSDAYSYGRARAIVGSLCIAVGLLLSLIDAASTEYAVDSIVLGLIFGTGIVLLGVEAGRKLLGG